LKARAAVGEAELVGAAPGRARRAGDVDPLQRPRQLTAVRVGVHTDRAADGARDVDSELDPAEPRARGLRRHGGQARAAAAVDARPIHRDLGELLVKFQDKSADARVRYEQVRPRAHDPYLD